MTAVLAAFVDFKTVPERGVAQLVFEVDIVEQPMAERMLGGDARVILEQWSPVSGYDGLYEISNLARVRRIDSGKLIATTPRKGGYVYISLSKYGAIIYLTKVGTNPRL